MLLFIIIISIIMIVSSSSSSSIIIVISISTSISISIRGPSVVLLFGWYLPVTLGCYSLYSYYLVSITYSVIVYSVLCL